MADSKSATLRSGHSLDIRQATRGLFVVKPQDTESLKAERKDTEEAKEDKPSGSSPLKPVNSPRGSANRSSIGHYSLGPHRYFIFFLHDHTY